MTLWMRNIQLGIFSIVFAALGEWEVAGDFCFVLRHRGPGVLYTRLAFGWVSHQIVWTVDLFCVDFEEPLFACVFAHISENRFE